MHWKATQWERQLSFRRVNPDQMMVNTQSKILDVPKYKIKAGLAYHLTQQWKIAVFNDHWDHTNTEANQYQSSGTEIIKIPSWTTANVNISFHNKDWLIGLYIENLFDK